MINVIGFTTILIRVKKQRIMLLLSRFVFGSLKLPGYRG
jgi:hypothetical protein